MTQEERNVMDKACGVLAQCYRKMPDTELKAEVAQLIRILQGCPTPGCLNLARDAGYGAPYCKACAAGQNAYFRS